MGGDLSVDVSTPMIVLVMIHLLSQEGRDQTVVEVAASAAVAIAGGRWSVTSDCMIRRRKCYQLRLNSSGLLVVSFYFLVNF